MKETVSGVVDKIIYNLKDLSELFQIIESKGGDLYYFTFKGKTTIENISIVFNGCAFTVDYGKRLPVREEGIYTKWMPDMFDIMRVVSNINNILVDTKVEKTQLQKYFKNLSIASCINAINDNYIITAV